MKKTILTLMLLSLAACGDNEPVQTVDWYKTNTADRLVMLDKCRNDPGGTALSANCENARAADNQVKNARKGYAPLSPTAPATGRN